ncbi:MAG: hypothetical protein ACREF9_02920 [Opitutaceae bacterium]
MSARGEVERQPEQTAESESICLHMFSRVILGWRNHRAIAWEPKPRIESSLRGPIEFKLHAAFGQARAERSAGLGEPLRQVSLDYSMAEIVGEIVEFIGIAVVVAGLRIAPISLSF